MPAAIRFVLFDAGNTLLHLDYAFIADVLGEHGHPVEPLAIRIAEYAAKAALDRALAAQVARPESIERLVWPDGADPRPSYFAVVLHELGIPPDGATRVLEVLHAHNRTHSLWRVVEPDTPRVLDALRARGLTLAVISNADGRMEADLERHGLAARFATVVDSHLVGVEKPDPRIFALALARLGAAPEAAIHVGDMLAIDVLGARRAGIRGVLMDRLGRYPGAVDCPRISRLAELIDLLFPGGA